MITWRDESSYSQDTKERVPTIWKGTLTNSMEITVHRYLHCEGWFVTCLRLGVDKRQLKSADVEDAKREALGYLTKVAEVLLKSLKIAQE